MTGNTEDDRTGWNEILNRRYGPSVALVCLGVWLHAADDREKASVARTTDARKPIFLLFISVLASVASQ